MFGVDVPKSYAKTTCGSLTPSYVSQLSVRTYGFLVVTTRSKSNSGKRLRRGGAFALNPCRARSSKFPPQTWARFRMRHEDGSLARPGAGCRLMSQRANGLRPGL